MDDRFRAFFDERMRLPRGNGGSRPSRDAGGGEADVEAERRLHVAACALLLELAHADDDFSDLERAHIEAVLRRHFALDEGTAQELMALAEEERESGDVAQFASLVRSSYDLGQKTLLAEIMWGLILSDGEIARHEATMLRKIAGLLDLEPGYLSERRGEDGGA